MNSFNHYAYGAVGNWMYTTVAGLEIDPEHPGYKHFFIRPKPGGDLTHASVTFDSPYGEIRSGWKLENGKFKLEVTVPPNTTATIETPFDSSVNVESGKHTFTFSTEDYHYRKFTLTELSVEKTALREIWRMAETKKILLQYAPELESVNEDEFQIHKRRTMRRVAEDIPEILTEEVLTKIEKALRALD